MLIEPAELLSLFRTIEETSENWKLAADREEAACYSQDADEFEERN